MGLEAGEIIKRLEKTTVIYTDVDGTFVSEGGLFKNRHGYTLNNARAIQLLLEKGVDVVMTSGREKETMHSTARLLGFQNYIANLGIEIVYDQGKRVISNFGAEVETQAGLKSWIEESGVVKAIFKEFPGKSRYYLPWSEGLRTHHLLIGELEFEKVQKLVDEAFPEIRIIDNGAVSPNGEFRRPHAYHILPRRVGKKAAVALDKNERHLSTCNLIGIGDSMEDESIAPEVAVFFLLDEMVEARHDNVVRVNNRDGEGFSRIIDFLNRENFL
ncbi:MAG: HAD-IIB family hydrolase [Calditrichia bacterium]